MAGAPARAPGRPDEGVAELTIPDIGSFGIGGSAGARPFVAPAGRSGDCRTLPAAEGTFGVPLREACETGGSPRPGERSTRPSAPDEGTPGRSAPLPLPPGGMVREFTALTPRRLRLHRGCRFNVSATIPVPSGCLQSFCFLATEIRLSADSGAVHDQGHG